MSTHALVKALPESGATQILTFFSAGERYGIPIERVREIIEYGEPTRVPLMPDFILGVINLRGAVVPVIDLSARFGLKRSVIGKKSCIIIVEVHSGEQTLTVGVLVDMVCDVIECLVSEIAEAPRFGTRIKTEFIQGMLRQEAGFMALLDIASALDPERLLQMVEGLEGDHVAADAAR